MNNSRKPAPVESDHPRGARRPWAHPAGRSCPARHERRVGLPLGKRPELPEWAVPGGAREVFGLPANWWGTPPTEQQVVGNGSPVLDPDARQLGDHLAQELTHELRNYPQRRAELLKHWYRQIQVTRWPASPPAPPLPPKPSPPTRFGAPLRRRKSWPRNSSPSRDPSNRQRRAWRGAARAGERMHET